MRSGPDDWRSSRRESEPGIGSSPRCGHGSVETGCGSAYAAALPGLLTGAIGAVGEESAEIECAPDLMGSLTTLVGDHPTLRVVPDARIVAGFRLVTVDHRVAVDETLECRLTSNAAELSLVAMRALEGP